MKITEVGLFLPVLVFNVTNTGRILTSVDQGLYPWPVAVLVYKSNVPRPGLPLSVKIPESRTPCVPHFGVHQQTRGVHGLQAVKIMESSSKSIQNR